MNPFGFLLRWLDRRIVRVTAASRRAEGQRELKDFQPTLVSAAKFSQDMRRLFPA